MPRHPEHRPPRAAKRFLGKPPHEEIIELIERRFEEMRRELETIKTKL